MFDGIVIVAVTSDEEEEHLLTYRQHGFTEDKLEHHLIIHFNNKE